MSIQKSISLVSILLLIVGLVVGGGGGYLISSSITQPRIREYETQITNFDIQVNDLTSEISRLDETLTNLELEKTQLESQIISFENQVTALGTQNSELEAQVLSLGAEISNLEGQVTSLSNQKSDLEDMISDQQLDLSDALEMIDELEDELVDLESGNDYLRAVLEYYLPESFTVGVTAFSSDSFFEVQAVANISQADINEYCEENEYPFRFDFIVYKNFKDPYEALKTTIRFDQEGINLFVGHETDPECDLSLNYVNSHDMLMISPSATSRSLSVPSDNFYRTCPTDLAQAPVMAEMLDSWGIEAVIVILRDDS